MTGTYADVAVDRATTFLNKLNAHCDTAKTGDYLMKFALTDGYNFRTVIFDHLLPTGKYGLLHFSESPLKVWHSMKFNLESADEQRRLFRVDIDVTKLQATTTSEGWRKPKPLELENCFYDALADIALRGLKDGSRIQPDKFRFLLRLGCMRVPSELVSLIEPLVKKVERSVGDTTALQDACHDFFRMSHKLCEITGGLWINFVELVMTENTAMGVTNLCRVSKYKRDVTSPNVSMRLSNDEAFQRLPDSLPIAVNGRGEWWKITPPDFVEFVSVLLYYMQ